MLEDGFVVRVPLARHPGASLVALQRAGAHPAGLVAVQHIASIVALELAKLRRARAIESGIAGSALHELLSGAAAPLPPERRLEAARFAADSEVQLVAIPASAARELRPEQLTERFFDQNVAAVSTCVGDAHFVLLDRRASLDALEDVSGLSVGVSLLAPLADGFGQLRRQALLALRAAQAQGGGVVRYSAEASAIVWLPTDDRGLLEVVDRILGPVLRYDEQSGSALLDSLRIYLEQDRSLSRSAALLFVHKHTLAYRLRRVEELTGRSLRSVRTMSDFWLGLEVLRLVASEDDERRFPYLDLGCDPARGFGQPNKCPRRVPVPSVYRMGQGERINAEDFADAMSLLATDQQEVVKAVAGKRDDKFDGLGWSWQGDSRSWTARLRPSRPGRRPRRAVRSPWAPRAPPVAQAPRLGAARVLQAQPGVAGRDFGHAVNLTQCRCRGCNV